MISDFFKKTSTLIVLVFFLIAVSNICTYFISKRQMATQIELAKADLREKRLAEEIKIKRSLADSIEVVKSDLADLQKIIIAQELTLKKPIDEKKVFDKYHSMPDSTAKRIFMDRYGTER